MSENRIFDDYSPLGYSDFCDNSSNRQQLLLKKQEFFDSSNFDTFKLRQLSEEDQLQEGQIYQAVYEGQYSQIDIDLFIQGTQQPTNNSPSEAAPQKISKFEVTNESKKMKEKRKTLRKISSCTSLTSIKPLQKKDRKIETKTPIYKNDPEFKFLEKIRNRRRNMNVNNQEDPNLTLNKIHTQSAVDLTLQQKKRTSSRSKKV